MGPAQLVYNEANTRNRRPFRDSDMNFRAFAAPLGAPLAALALATLLAACGGGGGATPSDAFPGKIDPSFGKDGVFDTRGVIAAVPSSGLSVGVDPAGRLLVAGWMSGAEFNTSLPLFARVLPAGALDPAFGSGGYIPATSPVPQQTAAAWAFPVAEGKAVQVHVRYQTCPNDFSACVYGPAQAVFRRVGPDGTPDPAFPGTILDRTSGQQAIAEPDGAVVLSGYVAGEGSSWRIGLRRVSADGQPDGAFAQNSDAVLACPAMPQDPISSLQHARIARLADGRILVARWDELDWNRVAAGLVRRTCLARLLPDGRLDTSFGQGGRVYLEDGGGEAGQVASVAEILPRSDGGIALVMNRKASTQPNSVFGSILWLAADGTVQVSRGDRGLTKLGPHLGVVAAAAVQADGRIVLAGAPPSFDFPIFETGGPPTVMRLMDTGQADAGFGPHGNGVAPIVLADKFFSIAGLALSTDGAIHVIGSVIYPTDPAGDWHLGVVKLFGGAR